MIIKTTPLKADQALKELKAAGSVSFDGTVGGFSVKGVEGNFTWDGVDTIELYITEKPFLVSQDYVEDKIREYFN